MRQKWAIHLVNGYIDLFKGFNVFYIEKKRHMKTACYNATA